MGTLLSLKIEENEKQNKGIWDSGHPMRRLPKSKKHLGSEPTLETSML